MKDRYKIFGEGGFFRCEIPSDWEMRKDTEYGVASKDTHSILLRGPESVDRLPATIVLAYYAPGNLLFDDAEKYLEAQTKPAIIPLLGEKTSNIKEVKIGKLNARTFTRSTLRYIPPHGSNPREIPMTEQHVVLDSEKGFFVLSYSAPGSIFREYCQIFRKILDTFQPFPSS